MPSLTKVWIVLSNALMMLGWGRVLILLGSVASCENEIAPATKLALQISFLELLNALTGITRSKPHQVLLFSVIRLGVELLVAPMLASCDAWQHMLTLACWSIGDTVRFFCFLMDNLVGGRFAKSVRYTVGPILFPLGTLGEMFIVIAAASTREGWAKPAMYGAACLWPVGFFSLFSQLLRQRRKFFSAKDSSKTQ